MSAIALSNSPLTRIACRRLERLSILKGSAAVQFLPEVDGDEGIQLMSPSAVIPALASFRQGECQQRNPMSRLPQIV